jgi:hypothetical protein
VVVGVGFFEGGYNHLLKTILWAAGVPAPTLLRMFPPPVYVLPSSVVFEATGILQLVLGIVAGRDGIRLWNREKQRKRAEKHDNIGKIT